MNGRFALLSMLLIRPYVKSHAYKCSVMLACPASFFKKDSRQAGMTDNVVLLMNSLVYNRKMTEQHQYKSDFFVGFFPFLVSVFILQATILLLYFIDVKEVS